MVFSIANIIRPSFSSSSVSTSEKSSSSKKSSNTSGSNGLENSLASISSIGFDEEFGAKRSAILTSINSIFDARNNQLKALMQQKLIEMGGTNSSDTYSSSTSTSSNISSSEFNFTENLSNEQKSDLEQFKSVWAKNKSRYQAVAQKTGVPAELIAALHWRESGCNFNTYLHNGDPLGKPTTHVPKGIMCNTWEESAIDALKSSNGYGTVDANNLQSYYDYAEKYNGLGYKKRGVASPYVWAGTSNYSCGKYVADGVYDASYKDRQLGVAVMLKSIMS